MKRWSVWLLTVLVMLTLATPVFAALPSGTGQITNCSMVSGSEFSSKTSIAKKLDKMFAGDIGLYKDSGKTKPVNAALGTRNVPNNGVYQYWGPAPRAGTSCFAYANAFYGHFYDGVYPHHSLNSNHKVIKAKGKITYENFVKWGVRDDAAVYIREGNHSIIVLTYDKNYITYVDGNGDAKGLIAIRKEAWKRGTGANIYNQKPSLIVQPTAKYFPKGNMKSNGAISCLQGGNSHDWDHPVVTKEATCKETGTKAFTCLDCGITKEETIGKTTDHNYGQWIVTKESTCTAKGQKVARCAVCEKEKTKTVKALGHKYANAKTVRESTIYVAGITQKTCQRCQKIKKIKSDCAVQYPEFGMGVTTQEGVFPKKTQLNVTAPEEPEMLMVALQAVTAKAFLFTMEARVEDTSVQPEGAVHLEIRIPEDFSANLGLYTITNGEVNQLASTQDQEAGMVSAEIQSLATFALCDLDVPYVPEPTQPETQPETQPTTAPVTEPTAKPAAALAQKEVPAGWRQDMVILVAAASVLLVGLATVVVIVLVRKAKKRKMGDPAENALEEAQPEQSQVP